MAVRGGSVKLDVRDEPLLEFAGNARHVDPRHGIWDYGPIDATSTALRTIRAGIVGTPASVQGPRAWLDKCRLPIEAKNSRLGHLFVPFPGFDTSARFRSTLVWDSRLERHIRDRDIRRLAGLKPQDAVGASVTLYAVELELLDEEPGCNVVIIARPETLPEAAEPEADPAAPWKKLPPEEPADDFRALLKATAMRHSRRRALAPVARSRQPRQLLHRYHLLPQHRPPDPANQRRPGLRPTRRRRHRPRRPS